MTNQKVESVSLLGCGWLGVALAHALQERGGILVRGSTTHSSRVGLLASLGIEPFLLRIDPAAAGDEFTSSDNEHRFFSSDVLLIDVPPEAALGDDYHPAVVSAILARVQPGVRAVVYVSSTSVYGAHQGAVDETTECRPDEGSGSILLRAEKLVSDWGLARGVGVTIVRPGGLIGPGRHPGLFLAGRRGALNPSSPVNMIHQLDLASMMAALIVGGLRDGVEIYNAVSNEHPTRLEFYTRAATAIGVEPPVFASNSFVNSPNKIVSSEKIRRVTGVLSRYDNLFAAVGVMS